jgi:enamine deaminase RidA (YjgF/YER057c/UK114 family)
VKSRLISTGSTFERDGAYSRAVVRGDWCFVAGITGYDYGSMTLPKGPAAQAEASYVTLAAVLQEAGFAMTDLVRVTHIVADRAHVPVLLPVFRKHLGTIRPAATMIVAGLMVEDMLYEVEATALRG